MRSRTILTTGAVVLTVFAMLSVHAVFQAKGVTAADMKVPAAASIHAELTNFSIPDLGVNCHVNAHARVVSDKIMTPEGIPLEKLALRKTCDQYLLDGTQLLLSLGCVVHSGPALDSAMPANSDTFFLTAFCPGESGEAALGILNRFVAFGVNN